jgi:lysophospholipase L1-like esterase
MKREHVLWLLMILSICVLVAASLEGFVRAFDNGMQFDLEMWKYARDVKQIARNPLIGHAHRPNREAHLMGVDLKINSKGLRDREIPYERTASTPRIMMLGDSFTLGWGVAFEDTFPKRVERLYRARGIDAEVINAGVGNYNTIMEVNYFLDEGYKYRPDVVVLNYIPNDAEPVPALAEPNVLLRYCHSCVFLVGRFDTLLRQVSWRPGWEAYYRNWYSDGRGSGWIAAKTSMGKLADYCRSHQIRLLIAHLPDLHDFRHYPFRPITALVQQAAQENGAEFVDVLGDLEAHDPARLWVSPSDPHPNALANELIANALFLKLQTVEHRASTGR